MEWMRHLALWSLLVAAAGGAVLAGSAVRERSAAAGCAAQGLRIDFASMRCVRDVEQPMKFAKRHTWMVGLTVLSTTSAVTFGWWYYVLHRLPSIMLEREEQKRRRRVSSRR